MDRIATIVMFPKAEAPRFEPETVERIRAYYALLSFAPELAHAASVVRASEVDRVVAGLREADRALGPAGDAVTRKGLDQLRALMRVDDIDRERRIASGGW